MELTEKKVVVEKSMLPLFWTVMSAERFLPTRMVGMRGGWAEKLRWMSEEDEPQSLMPTRVMRSIPFLFSEEAGTVSAKMVAY